MAGPRPPACRPPLSLLLLLLLLQASPSGGLSLRAAARRPLAASAAVVQPDYGVYLRACVARRAVAARGTSLGRPPSPPLTPRTSAPLLAAVRDLVAANPGTMRADTLRAELAGRVPRHPAPLSRRAL